MPRYDFGAGVTFMLAASTCMSLVAPPALVALAELGGIVLSSADLERELARMARATRAPIVLRELFAALGDDPELAAECLARPRLAEPRLRALDRERRGESVVAALPFDRWWSEEGHRFVAAFPPAALATPAPGELPAIAVSCTPDEWTPLRNGPPAAATWPSGVWTGSEMLVWGGIVAPNVSGGGTRYDPATDSWSPLRLAGEPQRRWGHQAVWTGSRMIVWGGFDNDGYYNNGGRYDPVADTWSGVASVGQPSARALHAAVWTGSEMIVWGGRALSGSFSTGGRYDPVANSWQATSTAGLSPRYFESSA